MTTLLSPMALEFVVMTISNAACNDRFGIMTTLMFQCSYILIVYLDAINLFCILLYNGLMQVCIISSALAAEIPQSCIKPLVSWVKP